MDKSQQELLDAITRLFRYERFTIAILYTRPVLPDCAGICKSGSNLLPNVETGLHGEEQAESLRIM